VLGCSAGCGTQLSGSTAQSWSATLRSATAFMQ
jgi:hypothetical protein